MINRAKTVAIMPNVEGTENKPFYRTNLKNHGVGLKEFSDKYQLGITDTLFGDQEGELFGPHWADELAKRNQFVILIDFMIIVYIPSHINANQYEWINSWKKYLQENEEDVRAIVYRESNSEYISYASDELSKIDLIYQVVEENFHKKLGR